MDCRRDDGSGHPIEGKQKMDRQDVSASLTAVCAFGAAITAMSAFAADLSWTGGDATLGGGKVQILCDGNGSVTNISAKPTGGEELRITGTAMTFASGATIEFAAPAEGAVAGGSLVFAVTTLVHALYAPTLLNERMR